MDPLTIAARKFIRAHEAAWDPPPGSAARPPTVLRLAAAPTDRGDILKSLRLLECQPENRRPISIVDAGFAAEIAYLTAIAAQVEADIAKVDAGLAEDGIARPALPARPTSLHAGSLLAHLDRLASHVAGALDGLIVVLAPEAVTDAAGFAQIVRAIASLRTKPTALRIDVLAWDIPGLEDTLPIAAAFELDHAALFDYLRDLGGEPSAGPKTDEPPPLSPEKRVEIETELGHRLISADAGRTLKHLLMDGGKALSEGRARDAVKKFRAARVLCDATGLALEAIIVLLSLGTAYITAENPQAAERAYATALERAEKLQHTGLVVQSQFGLGGLFTMQARWRDARSHYETIVELADPDSPLVKEALRMIEACNRGNPMHGIETSPKPGVRA